MNTEHLTAEDLEKLRSALHQCCPNTGVTLAELQQVLKILPEHPAERHSLLPVKDLPTKQPSNTVRIYMDCSHGAHQRHPSLGGASQL